MADLPHRDNPAGRLYLLLEKVRKHGRDRPFSEAWEGALGVEPGDQAKLLSRMASVQRLPIQIRRLVPLIPATASNPTIEPALTKIVNVLNNYHRGNVKSNMANIGADINGVLISVSSNITHSPYAEPIIEDEFLERVRSDIGSLYDDIQDSELPEAEKAHLLNLLDVLSNALVEVDIGGGAAIRSAAEEVLGAAFVDAYVRGSNPWRLAVGNLAFTLAARIASDFADDALPVVDAFFGQLGSG